MMEVHELRYVFNHLFLPPKLPQEDDSSRRCDDELTAELLGAITAFKLVIPEVDQPRWEVIHKMITSFRNCKNRAGDTSFDKVYSDVLCMDVGGKSEHIPVSIMSDMLICPFALSDAVPIHVESQNAGIIIRKLETEYSFESFELSPTASKVIQTKGRLIRTFPGPAIAVSHDRIRDVTFRDAFVECLTKLNSEVIEEACPKSRKAEASVVEIRDTINPRFVTEMLTGILRGLGRPVKIVRIAKRTRDDVLWKDTLKPWRRSPLWLLLRVSLQTTLLDEDSALSAHAQYKSFMIFLMNRVLGQLLQVSSSNDVLFVALAKISRRCMKFPQLDTGSLWMQVVQRVAGAAENELKQRWVAVQGHADPKLEICHQRLSTIDIAATMIDLQELRVYLIKSAEKGTKVRGRLCDFQSSLRTYHRITQSASKFPNLELSNVSANAELWLVDVETWVRDHMEKWLLLSQPVINTVSNLTRLIGLYIKMGLPRYVHSPENFSEMVLTLMSMWVCLDKSACTLEPLLLDYPTGFSADLFNDLMLSKRPQMKRLFDIEEYLAHRKAVSKEGYPSLFEKADESTSFYVVYFDQSEKLQQLKKTIEDEATEHRMTKKAEFLRLRIEHQGLLSRSNAASCEFHTVVKGGDPDHHVVQEHKPTCEKCALTTQARAMKITVHEWPLQAGQNQAKASVFDLNVPPLIMKWRDTTYQLIVDVFSLAHESQKSTGRKVKYLLRSSPLLKNHVRAREGRLLLASPQKEFTRAHYKEQLLGVATETSICVNNGLRCALFDTFSNEWTPVRLGKTTLRYSCTFKLLGPFKILQFALDSTSHTSNMVLSKQRDCPKSMTLHQLYAFATLRSGHRLQWRKIARELVARVMNFNTDETYKLLAQASWQVGPSSGSTLYRESHVDLREKEFGLSLLSALADAFAVVESNWQSAAAVRTFIMITARLLSLSLHGQVQTACLDFLTSIRKITATWTRDVLQLLHDSSDEEGRKLLKGQAIDLALTCHNTFDVDANHLELILCAVDNVAIVTEMTIVIHDHRPSSTMNGSPDARFERFFRLSQFMEPFLLQKILKCPKGLDCTVRRLWEGYSPGTSWSALTGLHSLWLVAISSASPDSPSITVHFNVLDGSLRVNGNTISRLPEDYEKYPTYQKLFNERVIEVVPSTMPGMVFETRRPVHGHQVHFAISGRDLKIRTVHEGSVYEMVPLDAFGEAFPVAFIDNYAHWRDTKLNTIEWRPLTDVWTPSPKNWRCLDPLKPFSLTRGALNLVAGQCASTITHILRPLESPSHVHIFFNKETSAVEAHLPRFNLDFLLQKQDETWLLKSKQFSGFAIDREQSFGSMTGLVNKLVLKDIQDASRIVIVPDGRISVERSGHHVEVLIDTGAATQISYHQFNVDPQLGRLVDNGRLLSRLFKLYLHGVTSHCLPDPLTNRTGTEEALYNLRSASTQSFTYLQPKEIDLLELIAELTPRRSYYPKHLKCMQTTEWASELSPLSQHESFHKDVEDIVTRSESLRIFQETKSARATFPPRGQSELQDRAALRRASERGHTFGAEFRDEFDKVYAARDQPSKGESRVCMMTTLANAWTAELDIHSDPLTKLQSWNSAIDGPNIAGGKVALGFDTHWLKDYDATLPRQWFGICQTLSDCSEKADKHKLIFFLAALSYSPHADEGLVQLLLAFATVKELHTISMPLDPASNLCADLSPTSTGCRRFLMKLASHTKSHRRECVADLVGQWRRTQTASPALPTSVPGVSSYIDLAKAAPHILHVFRALQWNCKARSYIRTVQAIMDRLRHSHASLPYSFSRLAGAYERPQAQWCFDSLFRTAPDMVDFAAESDSSLSMPCVLSQMRKPLSGPTNLESLKLQRILEYLLSQASGHYQQSYVNDLSRSFKALLEEHRQEDDLNVKLEAVRSWAKVYKDAAERRAEGIYRKISSHLQSFGLRRAVACELVVLPRISPSILLSLLAGKSSVKINVEWKRALTYYGLALANVQRAERILAAKTITEVKVEIMNRGHENWVPGDHPDWLLLELENNILIRKEQAEVAKEMIAPRSGFNSVIQLSMGKGKTSVIVPIVASSLANGTNLTRVVVLKALSSQMLQLLSKKLGGLMNRRVYAFPVSRSINLDVAKAHEIQSMYKACRDSGDVLLVQPEHLLSFELLGLDLVLRSLPQEIHDKDPTIANALVPTVETKQKQWEEVGCIMIDTQRWLLQFSRDILDESDEILNTRFEVIYTMGAQRATEFSPDRWAIINHVLGVFAEKAVGMATEHPDGIEILPAKAGAFPRIRILQPVVGADLLLKVARSICENGLPGVPIYNLPHGARALLYKFITDLDTTDAELAPLGDSTLSIKSMEQGVLLIRGLIAGGVLNFAFGQKRWRVNYGLDLSRTKLAVPYRAKDSPSARSEFSHPDSTIVLTSLSYYYGGLSAHLLRRAFEQLFLSDNAQEIYHSWIRGVALPSSLRHLSGVNLSNKVQFTEELFPSLRFSKAVIDYYMSNLVYPKDLREFPYKLSSSGWDIAREKNIPTTGFSGTNDSKYILPLSITQCDLPHQLSTNASVLACLLRPENTVDISCAFLDAETIMNRAVTSKIRVIIDVGAQILELRNEEVAHRWLEKISDQEVQAAVYFDDCNDLCVVERDGRHELLLSSHYAKDLSTCVVYLDEAHTRGTDLQLPLNYRAMVTLAPGLTKDRLVQACMRMRKLGRGQSVIFCAPLEIQTKILAASGKAKSDFVDVANLVVFTMKNSWEEILKCVPMWASQGIRHYRRRALCSTSSGLPENAQDIMELEAKTLVERYGFGQKRPEDRILFQRESDNQIPLFRSELEALREKCREFALKEFKQTGLNEEDMRELQPEAEHEQQVELPPSLQPATHRLHPHLLDFVITGTLNRFSQAFQPAFKTLTTTSASILYEDGWPQDLLVTADFSRTVIFNEEKAMDSFLRPVQWIISGKYYNQLSCIVLSPYEVNELLPLVRKHQRVTLHIYSPHLSPSNHSLEEMSFCAVPPVPPGWTTPRVALHINLFAGQLYLGSRIEYLLLCRLLGLCPGPVHDLRIRVAVDGFVYPPHRALLDLVMSRNCGFKRSPVAFLKVLFALRRKGVGFECSHIGRILNGDLLREADFEGPGPLRPLSLGRRDIEVIEPSK